MLDKVKELINRPTCHTITFTYESYGSILVTCLVKPIYFKSMAVRGIAGSDEASLDLALGLLEEVKELEKKIDKVIPVPPLDKQPYVDGYYREFLFEDYEVEFKRTPNSYVISGIHRKDEHGFYYVDKELVDGRYFKLEKNDYHGTDITPYRKLLKEGEELYAWDDIRYLSGSAGIVIVKDGRIIKSMGLAMA